MMVSYACFSIAHLLRTNSSVIQLVVILADLVKVIRRSGMKSLFSVRVHVRTDWPMLVIGVFYLIVLVRQSPLTFNTIWFATATWFPSDGKKANVIQPFDISYILTH